MLTGPSAAVRELRAQIERLARTDLTVCIAGPRGSGKDLVASAIHEDSDRAQGPFVVLDCAAISYDVAESVLFGYAAGAFTGALESREGFLEAANGGTLLLHEVGALPTELQPRLLRALEARMLTRVGEDTPRPLDVRILLSTCRDVRRVAEGAQFADELCFGMAESHISVPSLAERRDDISLLADEFLRHTMSTTGRARTLSAAARATLIAREYPGNARELRNILDRSACLCDRATIEPSDLTFDAVLRASDRPGAAASMDAEDLPGFKEAKRDVVDDFERRYLERLMARADGNIAMGAGLAGLERHYLRSLLKKHGLYAVT